MKDGKSLIAIWDFLYSRHFCILLFIISQKEYHMAAPVKTFILFYIHPQNMREQSNLVSSQILPPPHS